MDKDNFILMYKNIPVALFTLDFKLVQVYSNFYYASIENFDEFIIDRIPAASRRDIESLLFKWKINEYDIYKIALVTRLINPMDRYWIKLNDDETYEMVINKIFKLSKEVYSPSGNNVKEYYWHNNEFGIKKKRLSPVITDTESEVICYRLSKILGIHSCPIERIDRDWTFSKYLYDFNKDMFRHIRLDMKDYTGDLFHDLLRSYSDLKKDIYQMVLFDFITRQDDRHRSNIAVVYTEDSNRYLYPLYDNGRSLFFEDTESFIKEAVKNVPLYATSFGEVGSYYDCVQEIPNPTQYINTEVTKEEIEKCFEGMELPEYKVNGCVEWMMQCIEIIKSL